MKRIIKIGLWLFVAIVAALFVAVTAAIFLVDADSYRPLLQRQLSGVLGREVSIDHLSIGRSLHPTVAVKGLRVANPSWASRPAMLTVEALSVRLDLVELMRGRLTVAGVELEGIDLLLERGGDGAGNWELPSRDSPVAEDEAATFPDFDYIAVRDARVAWRDAQATALDFRISNAEAVVSGERPFEVAAVVEYRRVPMRLRLNGRDSVHSALAGKPVLASLVLDGAQAHAEVGVTMPNLSDFSDLEATIAANGERLDTLSALLGLDLPAWGPYAASAKLKVENDRVDVSELRLLVDGLPAVAPFAVAKVRVNAGRASIGTQTPTTLTVAGWLDDTNFLLDAATEPLSRLSGVLAGSAPQIPINARAFVGDFSAAVEGDIGLVEEALSYGLKASLRGDAAVLARILGGPVLRKPLEVNLAGRVAGDSRQVSVAGLQGEVAGCSVEGEVATRFGAPVQVSGTATLGRIDLAAFDVFDDSTKTVKREKPAPPAWMSALDAQLRLQVRDIVGLPVAVSDLSAHGLLRDAVLSVSDIRGSVAGATVNAQAALRYRQSRPYLIADVTLPELDVARVLQPGDRKDDDASTWLDTPLPLTALRGMDADLKIAVANIKAAPVPVSNVRGAASLQRGRLEISTLDATIAGVTSRSTLRLDASQREARLSAVSRAGRVDVDALLAQLAVDSKLSGTLDDAAVTVDTHGRTPRALLRNAKGVAKAGPSQLRMRDGAKELSLDHASIVTGPDVPVALEARGRFGELALDVKGRGGLLVDLFEANQPWPQVSAEVRTVIRDQPVRLLATSGLGPWRSGRDIPVRLEFRTRNGYGVMAGTIADLSDAARTPLDVEINVKSLANMPMLFVKSPLPDIPLTVRAKVALGDERLTLERFKLHADRTDLAGTVRLDRTPRLRLEADLTADVLDITPWFADRGEEGKTVEAQVKEDDLASLDRPIDVSAARSADAMLQLRARRFFGPGIDTEGLVLRANLKDGKLDADASIREGSANAVVRVDASGDRPVMSARIGFKDLDLYALRQEGLTSNRNELPHVSANLGIAGIGATPRALLQSARGQVLVTTGPGRIGKGDNPLALEAVSADLLTVLLPGKKSKDYAQLECAAARYEVDNGVATSPDGIALRFRQLDILGSGAVNLATGEISFGFKAVHRELLSLSVLDLTSDFASVGGTLAHPVVGLDTGGLLFKGGAAWATGGLSLLATSFLRKAAASENPCMAIAEKGHTASGPLDQLIEGLQLPDVTAPN